MFNKFPLACTLAALTCAAPMAHAQLAESGRAIASLSAFDDAMQTVMAESNIAAGVLAVSRNGVIVYQRGFGSMLTGQFQWITVPENTPMRIASCEKPITAAAIRDLINAGEFGWSTPVFNLGQPVPGVLNLTPFGPLGDSRLRNVTIRNVVDHRGGWNRSTAPIRDPQFKAVEIADAMNIASPPGRDNTIRYMLGEPLEFTPGGNGCMNDNGMLTYCYSNFGYMCLGRVIETASGSSYINFIRGNILTPSMWVPSTEIFTGRTFDANQNAREPFYSGGSGCSSVFDNVSGPLNCPYGAWEHEVMIGHGNLVMSAAAMLTFMENYRVAVGGNSGTRFTEDPTRGGVHSGSLDGSNSVMWQRSDGINIVVLMNSRNTDDPAPRVASAVADIIDAGVTWPTMAVDGFWIDFNSAQTTEVGGYTNPYRTMPTALAGTTNGSKYRLKPGTTTWRGTINKKVRIDAPLGTARLGV
ncbi:MAG: serine hydrolase domain-containing protein [Phycisphaerales bacterium]